jgi:DNA-binding transcriptional LysR family regulator
LATTNAGEAILTQCEVMAGAAENLERLVAGHDTRAAGAVRVTATDAIGHHLILPRLAALRQSHPAIQIDLITGIRKMDIARREADIAVRFSLTRPTDARLVCRKLGEVGFAMYASDKYLARAGTPKRGQGLAQHDLITFVGQTWPRSLGRLFMGESLTGARISLRSNDQSVHLRATVEGLGISELPCFLGDGNSQLIRIWPEEKPTLRPAWLITHEDLRRAARIKVVCSMIVEAFDCESMILRIGYLSQKH